MSINERINKLEKELSLKDMKDQTEKEKKSFKWTGKFRRTLGKNPKNLNDKVIVLYLNSKYEMEEPVIVPIISGGIIVYRDKGYKFNPKCLYTIRIGNKTNKVLLLREIDRLPVGTEVEQIDNEDFDDLKGKGRVPFNDPILLKMLWAAQVEKLQNKKAGSYILWIVLGIIAVIVVFMFTKG
jgi:hypothetical protein